MLVFVSSVCIALLHISSLLCVDQNQIPLFEKYPNLKGSVHHVSLGSFPTPIKKLQTLGSLLKSNNLFIKQDTASGSLFGGNKVRKLEFLLGDAQAQEAKGVATMGFAGSNHTCATTLYAKQCGMRCICMHLPQIPTAYLRRNLLLSYAAGAELNLYKAQGERDKALCDRNKAFKKETGQCLYFIPSGGSNELGTIGFVNAIFELHKQIGQGVIPEPDFIYVACGSCATTAGLMLGIKACGLKTIVVPICIEPQDFDLQHEQKCKNLFNITSQYLNKRDPSFPLLTISEQDVVINHDFVGAGYAITTNQGKEAIQLLERTENIKLDGTYAGKAFAAMLHDISEKKLHDKAILFWNTFCSGDFLEIRSTVDYKQLPQKYHALFENPLQSNDQGC